MKGAYVKIRIVLGFAEWQKEEDGDCLEGVEIGKDFEWPSWPQLGERVKIEPGTDPVMVTDVEHLLYAKVIEVTCSANLFEAAQIMKANRAGWDFGGMNTAAKNLLQKEVRRIQ